MEQLTTVPAIKEEILRIERNIMSKKNLDYLYRATGDRVAENLILYITYQHQYDLFGYGTLDPEEFASFCKYSTRYLREKVNNPLQAQMHKTPKNQKKTTSRQSLDTNIDDVICENRIENAFYALANYPLDIVNTYTQNDKYLIRAFGSTLLLDFVIFLTDKNTGKTTIHYRLAEKFRLNLLSYYLNINPQSLVGLRKSGLTAMYIFLVRMKEALFAQGRTNTTPETTPEFEYLCSLCDIEKDTEPKTKKMLLNRAIATIQKTTELSFTVEWVKNYAQQKYTPLFNFEPQLGDLIEIPEHKRMNYIEREKEKIKIAVAEFKFNLINACPVEERSSSAEAENFFYEWIQTDDPEEIKTITDQLRKTITNIGCKTPDDIEERIRVFNKYAKEKDRTELDSWLAELFSGHFSLQPQKIHPDPSFIRAEENDKGGRN